LRLRCNSYGPKYKINIKCPDCGKRQDIVIDLGVELERAMGFVKPIEDTIALYNLKRLSYNTFEMVTKKDKRVVVFRVGTGKDEMDMAKESEKKQRDKSLNKITAEEAESGNVLESLKRFIVSIDGVTNPQELARKIETMHASDNWHIREVFREVSCEFRLLTNFDCIDDEECGYFSEMEVPITVNFFRPADE
jgi:hypothetical protein